MKKIFILIFFIFVGTFIFAPLPFGEAGVFTQETKLEVNFFYSETCPHCLAEQKFLDEIEKNYPEVGVNRHLITDPTAQTLLKDLLKKHNAEKYFGAVPMNFVGEDFIPGFDNAEGIGKKIEESIRKQLGYPADEIEVGSKYSLPVLAITMGALDGFNICSLGALILILGLVLALRSRKKILLFGGIFILTTAVVYGFLINLWHQLFSLLAPYQRAMAIIIGIIGISGGIYFLKEFIRFKKYGPVCETTGKNLISKFSAKIQNIFKKQKSKNIFPAITAILLFAAIITIVEFPCSAAVPLSFAGILAKAQLPSVLYLVYIFLFILFYMLDEILIFLIALFTMKLWLASPKFVTWITLVEAIILFALGFYYLIGF